MATPLDNAFITEINQNMGIVHKVCRLYFVDAQEREDVLQEMMYQLWRSYPAFDRRSKFSTWMYSVCLHTAFTYRRKSNRRKDESLSSRHLQIPEPGQKNKDNSITLLMDAIATLSPVNKAVMLLYLENMSYEEIARVTGISRSNVSVRLVRSKKELETELKKKIKSIEDVDL